MQLGEKEQNLAQAFLVLEKKPLTSRKMKLKKTYPSHKEVWQQETEETLRNTKEKVTIHHFLLSYRDQRGNPQQSQMWQHLKKTA